MREGLLLPSTARVLLPSVTEALLLPPAKREREKAGKEATISRSYHKGFRLIQKQEFLYYEDNLHYNLRDETSRCRVVDDVVGWKRSASSLMSSCQRILVQHPDMVHVSLSLAKACIAYPVI